MSCNTYRTNPMNKSYLTRTYFFYAGKNVLIIWLALLVNRGCLEGLSGKGSTVSYISSFIMIDARFLIENVSLNKFILEES